MDALPAWLADLNAEELDFIRLFVLCSGSLKEMAARYGITYPTVRLRLDRLIQQMQLSEQRESAPFVELIKRLAVREKFDFTTEDLLIREYKKELPSAAPSIPQSTKGQGITNAGAEETGNTKTNPGQARAAKKKAPEKAKPASAQKEGKPQRRGKGKVVGVTQKKGRGGA